MSMLYGFRRKLMYIVFCGLNENKQLMLWVLLEGHFWFRLTQKKLAACATIILHEVN